MKPGVAVVIVSFALAFTTACGASNPPARPSATLTVTGSAAPEQVIATGYSPGVYYRAFRYTLSATWSVDKIKAKPGDVITLTGATDYKYDIGRIPYRAECFAGLPPFQVDFGDFETFLVGTDKSEPITLSPAKDANGENIKRKFSGRIAIDEYNDDTHACHPGLRFETEVTLQLPADLPKGRYLIDGEGWHRPLLGGDRQEIPQDRYKRKGGYPEIDIT